MQSTSPWSRILVEGVVIVTSILLAFAIDAWWDGRRDSAERDRLVEAMYEDFSITRGRLEESLRSADALYARTRMFLTLVADPQLRGSVPIDSLTFLLSGARLGVAFQPSLASYEAALSSGRIGLIEEPDLFEAITEFKIGLERFDESRMHFGDIYYRGAIWDLRRELGGLRVLGQDPDNRHPPEFLRSDAEMRALLASPVAYAAVENVNQIHVNVLRGLCQMHRASADVLETLGSMHEPEVSVRMTDPPDFCLRDRSIIR